MLPDRIIENGSLVRNRDRIAVSVRIPWYRALPLSSITGVELAVDGIDVPRDSIVWTVNDMSYRLDELTSRFDEWWYVLDSAVIEGDLPELNERTEHEIRVKLGLFIPYLPAGPEGFIAIAEHDTKSMPLTQGVRA